VRLPTLLGPLGDLVMVRLAVEVHGQAVDALEGTVSPVSIDLVLHQYVLELDALARACRGVGAEVAVRVDERSAGSQRPQHAIICVVCDDKDSRGGHP